jgi:DNA recombination protein RmuC
LWDECIRKRVLLASPTTLIAILYSIAFGWRQEAFEKNAEQIRKTGEDIYTRLAVFSEHLQDLGKHLTRSIGKYNEAIGSLEHNVLPSARKMKDLGISGGKKVLPVLPVVETIVRTTSSQDLFISGNGEA